MNRVNKGIHLHTKTTLCIVASFACIVHADTLELQPGEEGKDAAIVAHAPNDNNGNIGEVIWGSFGAVINGMRYISEFDISAIPEGSEITSAILTMTAGATSFNATHQYKAHLHRLTESWDESTVTYNSRNGADNWTIPGADFAEERASAIFTTPGDTPSKRLAVDFDITDLVRDWHDGTHPNYGFILVPETLKIDPSGSANNNYASWVHSEFGADPSLHPKLVINFTPPNSPPIGESDTYTVFPRGTIVVSAPGVLGNDTDVNDDPITATLVEEPLNGAVTFFDDGSFNYTHTNDSVVDVFTYKINDGKDDSIAVVEVNIFVINTFTAYNDLSWGEGQIFSNITRYTTDVGSGGPDGNTGPMVDYNTGNQLPVSLSVSGGTWREELAGKGVLSKPGTDAYDVFHGKVDATGIIGYGNSDIVFTMSGLDPHLAYNLLVFGNRDNEVYTERITKATLIGKADFHNQSTPGALFSGLKDESTVVVNGFNTDNGYVARFTNIHPGSDGEVKVILSGGRHYVNTLCLSADQNVAPFITQVGFSSDVEGVQDITEFSLEEILYVKVHDVNLGTILENPSMFMVLGQGSVEVVQDLKMQPNGSFIGETKLDAFAEGEVNILLIGFDRDNNTTRLIRDSQIILTE